MKPACGTVPQYVLHAHGAQIGHQIEQRIIAHRDVIDVGYRQGEACALQKAAHVADVGKREDAREAPPVSSISA